MIKTVIIEDDPMSLDILKDLIADNFTQLEIVSTYDNVKDAVRGMSKQEVDLVFLDMELPDGRGFDVLSGLGEINFEVIITTMHDVFMLEAIKHSAIDYLMKPVNDTALVSAVERFALKIQKLQAKIDSSSKHSVKSSRLVIPNQQGLTLTEISDIIRLESDGAYTHISLKDGSKIMASKNLGHFEEELSSHNFFRIHHKHLINLDCVKTYIRGDGGKVILNDDSSVEVSRRKKDDFLKTLES